MQFVIVTGLSGSGKSYAMNTLEDIGFYCIDNMPPQLISKFIDICCDENMDKIAIAVDIRSGDMFTTETLQSFENMRTRHFNFKVLYLEASDEILIRRYRETRRKHPLDAEFNGSVSKAIAYEREKLNCLREIADYYIDTSYLKNSQLKESLVDLFLESDTESISIKTMSFGFKYGSTTEADLVFDVRCLPNPFYIPELKNLTGKDKAIRDYVMEFEQSKILMEKLKDLIAFLIPQYISEGKSQLVIGFGCTGGKHRSVTFAEIIADFIEELGYNVHRSHRDISKT
ncbi:MAG: RNase adapter RapZ [Oscillospiraceae bacterium]|nr:RNase adapter RapZ [Ruminococcus sp.]MBP1566209.1 RNase adapter RapZ [Oscillospiraceae bacterium]MBQ9982910.1 RNase adapter RapZ [Oscillospiraceae bacterium]